jgi:lipoprotein-anchoring transpeptidase ErfK/SrfK
MRTPLPVRRTRAMRYPARLVVPTAALAVAVSLLASACGGSDPQPVTAGGKPNQAVSSGATGSGATPGASTSPPAGNPETTTPPVVTITPAADSTAVDPASQVQVTVANGTLTSVTATVKNGAKLGGDLDGTATTWTSAGTLGTDKTYTVTAVAKNADGVESTTTSTFSTSKPSATFVGTYTPDSGQTVGVGQPISIEFDKPITDKAAVEKQLTVEAAPAVQGAWHWFGNQRVDYRPEKYWTPGSKVTLHMRLDGVKSGTAYGKQNRDVTFSISQHAIVAVADASTHKMTVTKDGAPLRTLLISAGKPGYDTWNGTMVVQRKVDDITMDSTTVKIFGVDAYKVPHVRYAVQLTTSGTYVHGAPWNAGNFGKVNASHGCIGLDLDDAEWFYGVIGLGDPVTVVNSKDKGVLVPSNGFGDWNVKWADWLKGSALS